MLKEAWFGTIVGIAGLLIGIISLLLYLKSMRKPIIGFYKRGYSIIDRKDIISHDIKIIFDGKNVSKLNRTSFYIWNPGDKVIKKEDIAHKDSLRIIWDENIEIYEINISKINNLACNPSISQNENMIDIDFEYLDHNDGFRIDILHNSTSSSFSMKGTIIGAKKSIKYMDKKIVNYFNIINRFFQSNKAIYFIIIPIGLFLLLLSIFAPQIPLIKQSSDEEGMLGLRLTFVVMGLTYLLLVPFRSYIGSSQYPDNLDD